MNSNTAFQLSSPPLSPTSHKTFNTVRVRPTTTRPTASSLSLLSGPTSPLATKNHGHGHRHGHHGEHTPGPSPQRPGLTRAATATADMKAETEGEKLRKMTEVLGGRLSEMELLVSFKLHDLSLRLSALENDNDGVKGVVSDIIRHGDKADEKVDNVGGRMDQVETRVRALEALRGAARGGDSSNGQLEIPVTISPKDKKRSSWSVWS